MSLEKIKNYLLLSLLFLLPWQTRLIYGAAGLGYGDWEYGSLYLYANELLIGVVILLALVEKFRNKNFIEHLTTVKRSRLIVAILGLFLILSVYCRFVSFDREVTWQYLNWVIYAICLAAIIIESRIEFKKIVFWLWCGGVIQGFLAIIQFVNQSVFGNKWLGLASHNAGQLGAAVLDFNGERYLRAYGSFGWPNALGIYLSAIFLLGIILIINFYNHRESPDNKMRIILMIGQIIILTGLFYSFARGAWLATFFGIIILIWKNYKNKLLWQHLFVCSLVGIILLVVFKPLVFSRVDFQNRLEAKSISERVEQWQDFKIVFSQNKYFGVGPGVYTYALFFYHLDHGHDYQPVHNIFLLFFGEWGVVGLMGLLATIFYLRKRIVWSFAPLLSLLVAGLFDHWTLSMFTGLIFLGVLIALSVKYSNIDTISLKE